MRLTGREVEAAFVQTAREQQSGAPFDWDRCALHLNERLHDNLVGRARFLLQRPAVGVDGVASKVSGQSR